MSRHDLKELGEHLDTGQAGLVVVAVSDMGAKVERGDEAGREAEQKELKADNDEIERTRRRRGGEREPGVADPPPAPARR